MRNNHKQGPGSTKLRDFAIGLSDGLTVPFALAAALTAAVSSASTIVIGCIAAMFAGSVTMAFGGYRARRSEINEYNVEQPESAAHSALYIGASYLVGGMVPVSPFLFIDNPVEALKISSALTLSFLFITGYVKSGLAGLNPWLGAIRLTLIGAVAAGAAYTVAKIFEGNG